ncbi:rhodanese-like domain-containing protein [Synechococcus sp. Tobar12-5m-g]|uniref:rhodanese-like domain-containing protein n=1 Tax=unclassified Synechococcus TaxID=2626047 RepID=UPI0020CBD152|nr:MULTISPECIES: rhodanese-like domain-containing protein [unclassified Synechococcus]MCP9772889.1 rhodanese-like domain-containing protein [Synechococcus sp. Tobar12-5m-g]MCP9873798.1 rhodanese-like domain-containing protein [Synechococcus sp. Cruz CV-v-12]
MSPQEHIDVVATTSAGEGSDDDVHSIHPTMTTSHGQAFLQRAEAARRQVREINPKELKVHLAEGATLIDVREEEEFDAGHIPGARNVKGSTLSEQAPTLLPDPSQPIALVCGGGNRSAIAALELQTLGYSSVVSLQGGLRQWPEALVRPVSSGR